MNSDVQRSLTIRFIHNGLLCLNIGFAFSFAILTNAEAPIAPERTSLIEQVFGYTTVHFTATAKVCGLNLALVGWMLATALLILVVLALLRRAPFSLNRMVVDSVACISALAAVPVLWMLAVTHSGRYINWWNEYPWWLWWTILPESCLVMGIVSLTVIKRASLMVGLVVMLAHYGFWGYYMRPAISHAPIVAAILVVPTCVGAGILWLLYTRADTET